MDEKDKSDFDMIAEALLTAFAEDPLAAHVAFRDRKYLVMEGVDSFLNELKRLGRIAGASDMTLKMDFITGLPQEVSDQLRSTPRIQELSLPKILDMAQSMVQMREERKAAPAAMVTGERKAAPTAMPEEERDQSAVAAMRPGPRNGCYECGRNHFIRNCPDVKNGRGERSGRDWNPRSCGRMGGQRRGAGIQGQPSRWLFHPDPPVTTGEERVDQLSGNI